MLDTILNVISVVLNLITVVYIVKLWNKEK